MSYEKNIQVIEHVQIMLRGKKKSTITPAIIEEKIDTVIRADSDYAIDLDRGAVLEELIRRYSSFIESARTLQDKDDGHVVWLDSARKKNTVYWNRYRQSLVKNLPESAIDVLDESTDTVLGLLEDPNREGSWDRRGLVVGHVQSGKTAHYTGLICKAADAGYKIIIVLAGLHNNLRSQTQIRLEEGFLGYDKASDEIVGVGLMDSDRRIQPNSATTRADRGDFSSRNASNLAISPEERPWLFVVKKNKTVLRELLKWIQHFVADTVISRNTESQGDEERIADSDKLPLVLRTVSKLPLIIIDDESDNASVDTGEQIFDADDTPDEEHNPKTINKLIRRLLLSFEKSAYVGYTATPFANIFIHERGKTIQEGVDLFPSAFIHSLSAPSNYVGPSMIFGKRTNNGRRDTLGLIRTITDAYDEDGVHGWMPINHKNGHQPLYDGDETLPPSLKEAIHAFVLACAVRDLRGHRDQHSSMLIHVSRYTSVQGLVRNQVDEYFKYLKQRIIRSNIDNESILNSLKDIWETDFLITNSEIELNDKKAMPEWGEILKALPDVVSDIKIIVINGTAKDALDYSGNRKIGLKVIAIGGDKLSRGLTLEGLCVSYFLRSSKMYDTLMQMGRWFGYRPGYLDLCRLYTTTELIEWFEHITDAAEELREEFDLMVNSGGTPRKYGLKVLSHPELMVTSVLKMRSAKTMMISFSGNKSQTIIFPNTTSELKGNQNALKTLVNQMGDDFMGPGIIQNGCGDKWNGSYLWTEIPSEYIVHFLQDYKTHEKAYSVNSSLLAEYIQKLNSKNELTKWTVLLAGAQSGKQTEISSKVVLKKYTRKIIDATKDSYRIKVLLDPKDERIGLTKEQWDAALDLTQEIWHSKHRDGKGEGNVVQEPPKVPSNLTVREVRGLGRGRVKGQPEYGVLVLYVLDTTRDIENGEDIVAFGISFPSSNSDAKVEYIANNVLWGQQYGASE